MKDPPSPTCDKMGVGDVPFTRRRSKRCELVGLKGVSSIGARDVSFNYSLIDYPAGWLLSLLKQTQLYQAGYSSMHVDVVAAYKRTSLSLFLSPTAGSNGA